MSFVADKHVTAPILAVAPAVPQMAGRAFTVFGTFGSLFVTGAQSSAAHTAW